MLNRSICLAALVLLACQDSAAPPAKPAAPDAAPPPPDAAPPPPDAAPPDAALPEDPKARTELRNKAILDGRYEEALAMCAAEDMAALDEQSVMSCVLTACRLSDVDKAQAWGKRLKGPLKSQAKKICLANRVPI